MIIEHEKDGTIIYSNATMEDFERAARSCRMLAIMHTRLERVVEGDCINIYWKATGETDELLVSYNVVEQELTVIY